MKRIRSILILLACCLAWPALAEGNRLLPFDKDAWVSGLLSDGETLYMPGDGLYTWKAGDAVPRRWEDRIDLSAGEGEATGWRTAFDGITFFLNDGKLCGARLAMDEDEPRSLQLCDIAFTDAGEVEAVNVRSLSASKGLRDSGIDYLYSLCIQDGALYLLGGTEEGAVICAVDSADPDSALVRALQSWNSFKLFPAPGGPILAEEGDDEGTTLYRVTRDGSVEALCALPPCTGSVAVDPLTGEVFAALDGRIFPVDVGAGTFGDPVSALPLDIEDAAVLSGGRSYAALMRGNVAVVAADERLAEGGVMSYSTSISGDWMDEVMLRFAVEHPELALARANAPAENVLDGMLTQSRDVDVFIMDMTDGAAAYEGLLKRGYMLPLDGREPLRALYERMYPGFQRWTGRNGAIVALPIDVGGEGMGVNESLLGRLGLSLADVPDSWMEFLDFLGSEIRPRLDRLGPGAQFTYGDMSAEDFRFFLRMHILNDWVYASDAAGVACDYEDARLVALLERVEDMDLTGYGLEEGQTEADGEAGGHGYSYGGGDAILIQFGTPYDFEGYAPEGTPLLLGFGDDLPGVAPMRMHAAFINPYSAHREAALDLLEALRDRLPVEVEYALCPDLAEPTLRPEYENAAARYRRELEAARIRLGEAEPKDRQLLEEVLASLERQWEDYDTTGKWLISPEKLKWYRAHGDRVTVACPTWFNRDTSGEAYELEQQYYGGLISARQFLAAVNRKARMMAMEQG